jgi:hypothetical protein
MDRAYDNFSKFIDHKQEAWYEQTNPTGIIKELQGEKVKEKSFLNNLDKELNKFKKNKTRVSLFSPHALNASIVDTTKIHDSKSNI